LAGRRTCGQAADVQQQRRLRVAVAEARPHGLAAVAGVERLGVDAALPHVDAVRWAAIAHQLRLVKHVGLAAMKSCVATGVL
jgi:hypothetical protein